MICPDCGTENREGRKFCSDCGRALALLCPACGTANEPGERFCGECGSALTPAAPSVAPAAHEVPASERRLVSVLFVDLVGFTTISEARDSEEARELLSRYSELARTLIKRYGGTVEKFIGDAVMAVWGTPTTTEDDAERAVRAALDLVASVPELDQALQARAGVLTGEAAVTLGAEGEGMVAGDLVNTASRIQTAAEPGTVLVGDATRRSTEQAIVYESAGEHELKGKAEPVDLWRALRVVSARGGSLKSAGLEPPFIGRDRELKLIKDLFHGCANDRRAHLVSVIGIAGHGKSRLVWEFYKYFDGIVQQVYWHRGRCLAYGEGVAYWALADMVRMRAGIGETEDASSARPKLSAMVERYMLDAEERAFVEPRLAHLLVRRHAVGGHELARLRRIPARVVARLPAVRDHARATGAPRAPAGMGRRSAQLHVPLSRSAFGAGMRDLLEGLVPGLPEHVGEQILARAEGVPLYAVETVRMLLDRGLLVQEGPFYRPTGEIEALEVPETLHALIAARLDGLAPEERRLLQDGAVLGKTFSSDALASLSGIAAGELEPLLSALVRKEVLSVQSDPRSPERGQYGFLQDLVRHVAYETISKRERKSRHLDAAAYIEATFGQDEVPEVLASHYLSAFQVTPDADDAQAIRVKAEEMLTRAAERAASLGAPEEGRRYYDQAAELTDERVVEAGLLEQAGRLAFQANRPVEARERLERALAVYREMDEAQAAARASAALADVDFAEARFEQAVARLEPAVVELEQGKPSAELATALAQLGRCHVLAGHGADTAAPLLERALTLAERLQLPEVFVEALNSKGLLVLNQGRLTEARILLAAAVEMAHAEQVYGSALRAENNFAVVLETLDRFADAIEATERSIAFARRRGNRRWESKMRTGLIVGLFLLGRWDEALAIYVEEEPEVATGSARGEILHAAQIHCERGSLDQGRALLAKVAALRDSDNSQLRAGYACVEARLLRAEGRAAEALSAAERALAVRGEISVSDKAIKMGFVEACEAALALPDLDKAEELLGIAESLEPGDRRPFLQANSLRLRARLDAARGRRDGIDERLRNAASMFREFDFVFHLAVTQLEHGEWLAAEGRDAEAQPLLAEAYGTFERLQATPWLERATRVASVPAAQSA